MRKQLRGVATALALALTLWLIFDRLRIVILVSIPWWGFLIIAVLLFLAIDYLISRIFDRTP
ncbi:MAG: hypothetical protein RLZZ387_5317 [Chloroflexota bacterium]|jgi:hypothetical protein